MCLKTKLVVLYWYIELHLIATGFIHENFLDQLLLVNCGN
jgi:hypothetical protein